MSFYESPVRAVSAGVNLSGFAVPLHDGSYAASVDRIGDDFPLTLRSVAKPDGKNG